MKNNMCQKHSVFQRAVSVICALSLSTGLAQLVFAAGSGQLSDHVVTDTVDPSGISLNLFDYWVTPTQGAVDTATPLDTYRSSGINNGHQLKFFSSGSNDSGTINA